MNDSMPPPLPVTNASGLSEPFALTKSSYRLLIILSFVTGLISLITEIVYASMLPIEIKEYISANTGYLPSAYGDKASLTALIYLALFVLTMAFFIWSQVALICLKGYSVKLNIILIVVSILISAVNPASIQSGINVSIQVISWMLSGAVIALAYWSPAKHWFS